MLNKANVNFGTLDGLKSQMEKINDLGEMFYMTESISNIGKTINIGMEKLITDGKFVYV